MMKKALGLLLITMAKVITSDHIDANSISTRTESLDYCNDSRLSFYVGDIHEPGYKTCSWARRLATHMRCNLQTVRDHCPVTCNSCIPNSTVGPSFSASPSTSPTELNDCGDLKDNDRPFLVSGTLWSGRRKCDWAKRLATRERCRIDAVRTNCPLVCDVPCTNNGSSPPLVPFSKIEKSSQNNSSQQTTLLIVIPCLIASIVLVTLLGKGIRRKRRVDNGSTNEMMVPPVIHMKCSDESIENIEEHVYNDAQCERAPSFVGIDQHNEAKKLFVHDVAKCSNFACQSCANHKRVEMVRVSRVE
mmetsp:Transcript_22000/g.33440  ORF Transcript_22000/g.33440 Transcript_22000/m.33440 type:complete len:303 (+) Transcript_22000:69-977(+)